MTYGVKREGMASLVLLFALMLFLVIQVLQDPLMVNNGDYWRSISPVFDFPAWSPPPEMVCPNLQSSRVSSTMSLLIRVASLVAPFWQSGCVPVKIYSATLLIIFTLGALLAIRQGGVFFPVLISLFLATSFSFLFSSFYEEAIVLPVVVWLIYGYARLIRSGKEQVFVWAAAALIYAKAQMVVFFPLLMGALLLAGARSDVSVKRRVAGAFVLCISLLATVAAKSADVHPNSFNRIYNGIGWSVLGVSSWPAENFNQRHQFFYANRAKLKADDRVFVRDELGLMGTSFWPTGKEIMRSDGREQLVELIRAKFFVKTLFSEGVLRPYLQSVYTVTLESDYSLSYLLSGVPGACSSWGCRVRESVAKNFGFIYFALTVLCVVMSAGMYRWATIFYMLMMPVMVVVGDGFYEFEKHMVPYFMVLPIFACIARVRRYVSG